uniref:Uncharacterized protein n=1 Tax=Chromera velia CCMP2878 TaxID=1169474 RepID=A0A0G4HD10_9ALVE|eukprot:Cvel_6396.t1-p1 / transcript=Cvel_6396.t1 / gene=Cvel_6396 / organism=Chromera_velia_CCMP2878 / gene_product=hypothetical protein / transcript_product=hypothetical protein / location=Cvel_scaffold312:53537-54337(-) / protein_length=267 / sequence_SO=supercontig / SO=protein_coding / is_pseudo=false
MDIHAIVRERISAAFLCEKVIQIQALLIRVDHYRRLSNNLQSSRFELSSMVALGLELLLYLDTEGQPDINREYQALVPAVLMVIAELREVDRLLGATAEELAPRSDALKGVAQRALRTFGRWRTTWTPTVGGEFSATDVMTFVSPEPRNVVTVCVKMGDGGLRHNCLGNGPCLNYPPERLVERLACETENCGNRSRRGGARNLCHLAPLCRCVVSEKRRLPDQLQNNYNRHLREYREIAHNDRAVFGEDFSGFLASLQRVATGNFNF